MATACATALAAVTLSALPAQAHATIPYCANSDLRASLVNLQGTAGSQVGDLRLTNVAAGSCWTRGYPGVSYVGYGNGTQIGRAAAWDTGTVRTITLAPGQHADSPIRMVDARNYPAATCLPTPVDGLRVYVPGSTLAKYIPHPTTGCRSSSVTTIFVRPLTG
ncbi:conserved exported hypothetical protein [Nostocoides japonicum T1-X7]|uniref:DUF4232 domain-containing protein n=1 Tax=Nostocoides japonicum T1-X7 TaxID=1194083 RepID=A0A077LUG2_9MICO|nr:conserved exported hypothetical protein [Tetrasphaera japonica T1-X7]